MDKNNSQGKYRDLAKNTILFTISSFGSKILSFLLVPLYTALLSTSDYGTVDLISTSAQLLIFVFTINIADAVLRFAIDKKEHPEEILSYGFRVLLTGSAILAIIGIVCWQLQLVNWPDYCYLFLFLYYFFSALNQIFSNYLRAVGKVSAVAVAGILTTAVTILSNLIFLLAIRMGLLGYLIAAVLGMLISTVYCAVQIGLPIRVYIKNICDSATKKEMRHYSIPLIFNGVSWWINSGLNKYFLTAICGMAVNGIYAVSSKIPTILSVFQSIFAQAWNLSAIKEFDKEDKDGFFSKTHTTYHAGLVLLSSGLILMNIPLSSVLFSGEFFAAWKYSSVLLISGLFSAMNSFLGSIFSAVKKSKVIAISTVTSAAVNTVLCIYLIPVFGAQGAAIATAVAFGMTWIMRLVLVRKYIALKINVKLDILAYLLLVAQVVAEHTADHAYFVQIIILILLFIIYRKPVMNIVNVLVKKVLKK